MTKPPLRQGSSNDFQTPPEALTPLLPFINRKWKIWEPAAGRGNLVVALSQRGYKVFGTDIKYRPSDEHRLDFLIGQPKWKWDMLLTNPPYSLKQQFLERCYELGKPFALLLPLTTFETEKRQKLFRQHGLEVIFLDKRINFQTPSGRGSGSWFATAWFTWGLHLPSPLFFGRI